MPALRHLLAATPATVGALFGLMLAQPAGAAVSSAVGKALQQAQKSAASGNSSAAIAAVRQAQAAASTPEEKQKAAQMAGYVYTRAGQYGAAAAALEAAGASPRQLAPLYYQAGQYDRAIATAKRGGGEDMQILIAQAYTRQGKPAQAIIAYQALIKSNGAKPVYLENLAGAQFKAGDKKAYLATTERLVKVDGSAARWKTLLVNFAQNPMRSEAKLALFHLMQATGTLDRPQDWAEYARLALVSGQSGIAQGAVGKAGAPTDTQGQRLVQAAAQMTAASAAQAPKLAAAAATAVRGGNAYLGLRQYPQAMAAFDKAIAANSADADQAQVFKGIAALHSGNVAAGKAAFAAVPATSGMHDIAALWTLYAATRGRIPAA